MKRLATYEIAICLVLTIVASTLASAQSPVKIEVKDQPFVANLFLPAGEGPFPAILAVGGSGGGIDWQNYMGEILAGDGFAVLALAYFRMDKLPAELERIPIEYFQTALEYLRNHKAVDSRRIGTVGVSKGGELVLLLASLEPSIRAVAAFVPGSVVFQSIARGFPRTSSWTFKGEQLPFVAYAGGDSPSGTLADLYRRSLDLSDNLERATIKVEKINGPILLLSGQDDTLLPSSYMSEKIIERLRRNDFAFHHEHVAYPGAGHLISIIRDGATARGGTEEGNRFAQQDGQRRTRAFFRQYLSNQTSK